MKKMMFVAAAVFAVGAARAEPPKCQLGILAELPVTMRGDRPLVTTKIDGAEATFIADSGAFFSTISPGVAAELKLKLEPAPNWLRTRGLGGSYNSDVARIREFGFAGHSLSNVDFLVGGSEMGETGLLGQNILTTGDAEFDFSGGTIRLIKAKGCSQANLAYWAKDQPYSFIEIEPLQPVNRHIIGNVFINGIKMRAMFDTGAYKSVLSLKAAKRIGIEPNSPGVQPAGSTGGLGRKRIESWIAPKVDFKIGDEEIRGKGLRFADLGDFPVDMLIGADFFLAHHIYVAYSQNKLFFTYSGGPVFDATAQTLVQSAPGEKPAEWKPSEADRGELADAEAYSRRGAALTAKRDFEPAIADLTRALEMSQGEPRYRLQRAMAYLGKGDRALALTDIDLAIEKKPDFIDARILRANMRMHLRDPDSVRADLEAIDKSAAKEADQRFAVAGLYDALQDWRAAIGQWDLWIPAHHDDNRQPFALNGRCWARAMLGVELDKALSDCNAAMRLRPKDGPPLDSRGMVWLRMNNLDRAITDYDAALAAQPNIGWSLFGRGLAKLRKGNEAEGKADIAAAVAIAKDLPERAVKIGLIKSAADPR
jgi:tetratricopeptide (TPR) repeat protein/predicted aspartyl protease